VRVARINVCACGLDVAEQYTNCVSGYGTKGERLVAGIVPLSKDKRQVLLISSTRRTTWVLPKGGWELDEPTVEVAATREAWEEAGIIVTITGDLGKIDEKRHEEQFTLEAPRAAYHFFEATVEKMEEVFPESGKRNRKWMSYEEAREKLQSRPELLDALERSSVVKS
jgi:diphosphoinositol-polyphosphate diphosphatase